jgi:hypothetical protein
MGSSSDSFPASRSRRMAAAVNCLVTDAISYSALGGVGTSSSRSALPYPLSTSVSPPRRTPTDSPATAPLATASCAMESTRASMAVAAGASGAASGAPQPASSSVASAHRAVEWRTMGGTDEGRVTWCVGGPSVPR